MEEMQKDCLEQSLPELAALVLPYTSEQSLPSDPVCEFTIQDLTLIPLSYLYKDHLHRQTACVT